MPLLKYWIAERLDDSSLYSIIAKTKREVVAAVSESGDHCKFGPIHQRELYYEDAFDLFDVCTGEDGGRVMGYRASKKKK